MNIFTNILHSSPQQGSVWISKPHSVPGLAGKRPCSLYLPPDYQDQGETSYPLMYLFDGHNLFDDSREGGVHWCLHKLLDKCWAAGVRVPVVVGIHHGSRRDEELSPWLLEELHTPRGDLLLNWLVHVLHPHMQENFAVDTAEGQTALGGAFLGGLMAIYGCFRHRRIFGKAFSLSPSLWAGQGILLQYIAQILERADFEHLRIYLDTGLPAGTWGWPAEACRDHALAWLDKKSDRDARALVNLLEAHALFERQHIFLVGKAPRQSSGRLWERSLNLGLRFLFSSWAETHQPINYPSAISRLTARTENTDAHLQAGGLVPAFDSPGLVQRGISGFQI